MRLNVQHKTAERDACAHAIARNWARSAIAANGSVINVKGIENVPEKGGVLFIANHQSNFDIPIFIGFVPRDKGFIAKKELEKIPVFSMWMKYLGCVFINRKDARKSLQMLDHAAERLKAGHSLVIFPEGTRSLDGNVGQFKTGSLRLALKANVAIVPVTISGSKDIMPKGTSFIKSAKVDVVIAPPLFLATIDLKDPSAMNEKIRGIIVANLNNHA